MEKVGGRLPPTSGQRESPKSYTRQISDDTVSLIESPTATNQNNLLLPRQLHDLPSDVGDSRSGNISVEVTHTGS